MLDDSEVSISKTNSFFYSNDRNLRKSDDILILSKIREKYPDFIESNKDIVLKKLLVIFLDDNAFVEEVLSYFDISIQDLMIIIFRSYGHILNSYFLTTLHEQLKNKKYVRRS